jgi:hypothetical protein
VVTIKNARHDPQPFSGYEDILFLSLSSPSPASASSLPLAVRHHHPSVGLQSAVVVFLGTGLYSVLRFRYRQPLLKPLGWVVPRRIHAATALPSS